MPLLPGPPPEIDPAAVERLLGRMARLPSSPWLHQEVARRMAERLPLIRQTPDEWVDWWAFWGGGAEAVQQVLPGAVRRVVEPTPGLVQRSRPADPPWWALARRRAPRPVIELVPEPPAAIGTGSPAGVGNGSPVATRLLWANMVLHATADPTAMLRRWHRSIEVGGFLMFSTLGPSTLQELRSLFQAEGWPSPHAAFVDMHDLGDLLVEAGFADPVMDQELIRLTWSSPQALLAELRSMGHHLGRHRFAGLRTPRWMARLQAALARRADAQGRIGLSFEVVYGHAFKVAPKPARDGSTEVPLDDLRAELRRRKSTSSD